MAATRAARGRPAARKLDRDAVISVAMTLLEQRGEDFSMREIARWLAVDAMAIYHYFPSKGELLKALAVRQLEDFSRAADAIPRALDANGRLDAVCEAYLAIIRPRPNLVRLVAQGLVGDAGLAQRFAQVFDGCLEGRGLDEAGRALARDTVVDFLHGHALAGDAPQVRPWTDGVAAIVAGAARAPARR